MSTSKSALIKALYTERAAMLNNNCFRAWDEKEKLMMHGDFIEENCPTYTAGMSYGKLFVANSADGEWYECVVMQWTGLYDKTGKQIFEGDILQPARVGRDIGAFVVMWDNKKAGYTCNNGRQIMIDTCDFGQREVIGNIYENPELPTK